MNGHDVGLEGAMERAARQWLQKVDTTNRPKESNKRANSESCE